LGEFLALPTQVSWPREQRAITQQNLYGSPRFTLRRARMLGDFIGLGSLDSRGAMLGSRKMHWH
jgi:hypothetical protein